MGRLLSRWSLPPPGSASVARWVRCQVFNEGGESQKAWHSVDNDRTGLHNRCDRLEEKRPGIHTSGSCAGRMVRRSDNDEVPVSSVALTCQGLP